MAGAERLVRFTLLGQEFSFYTAASDEEMEAILSLIRDQVEDTPGLPRNTVPASKLAVMACLNIASKYVQLQNEYQEYKRETGEQFARLNKRIASSLADD